MKLINARRDQPLLSRSALLATMAILIAVCPLFGQWESDQRLTYNDSLSCMSYNNAWCVAATGDTIHVVWWDGRDHTNGDIFYKRSTDAGVTWGPDTRIRNDTADTYSYFPSLAVSGSSVHVVWVDGRDGTYEIYYDHSTNAGSTWSPDIPLTLDPAFSYNPVVAVLDSQVHVVWRDNRDGNYEIYYKRSIDGGTTWGADTRLTSDPAESWYPSIAVSGFSVHLVWFDDRDGNPEIYYKRSIDGGTTWGADTRLTNAPYNSDFTSIAVAGSDVHIAWRDYRDGNMEIYYKRSTDNGDSWGNDARLTNDTHWSDFPSIAVSISNVHIAWADNRDGNREIYYKRSTDRGVTWEPDTRLTYAAGFSRFPSLAVSGSKVHTVWEDNRDGNYEVYYKRDPTGNSSAVEENPRAGKQLHAANGLKAVPDPFVCFTTIPGHELESFALYDIAGQRVGTFRGDRIGRGLPPGVYFIQTATKDRKPARIVKVR